MSTPAEAGEPVTWWNTASPNKFLKIQKRSTRKNIFGESLAKKNLVQTAQSLRSVQAVQTPSCILPRDAGEDRSGGLNDLNSWNGLNRSQAISVARKVKASHQIIAPVIPCGLLAILAGCSRSEPEVQAKLAPGTIVLTGAGATFPSVFYNRLFAVYHDNHPKIVIKYAAVGSGEGGRRFIGKNPQEEEKVDFGASDAPRSDADIASAGNTALMIPVTAGCVVLAYNLPSFQGELKLSRRAYTGIFLGEIKTWNDPLIAQSNPGIKLPT
jgi:PBP superfamily domain